MNKYENTLPIARKDAERALQTGNPEKICDALVRLAFHEKDRGFVEEKCLSFASHPDASVRGIVATSFGHLARIHGQLDEGRVIPVLEKMMADRELAGQAEDALDDIRIFLKKGKNPREAGPGTIVVTYDTKRISNFSKTGFECVDDGGRRHVIDFAVCRRNWVSHFNNSGDFTRYFGAAPGEPAPQNEKPTEAGTHCVALRDASAKPMYFEFFMEPRIRINFPKGWRCWRPYKPFHELSSNITGAGWGSYDLS